MAIITAAVTYDIEKFGIFLYGNVRGSVDNTDYDGRGGAPCFTLQNRYSGMPGLPDNI